jgi:hypothetical protein
MLVGMSSDLRERPDRIAGDDWWLLQPHARRLAILGGLAEVRLGGMPVGTRRQE